jgi:hypothetical protein
MTNNAGFALGCGKMKSNQASSLSMLTRYDIRFRAIDPAETGVEGIAGHLRGQFGLDDSFFVHAHMTPA